MADAAPIVAAAAARAAGLLELGPRVRIRRAARHASAAEGAGGMSPMRKAPRKRRTERPGRPGRAPARSAARRKRPSPEAAARSWDAAWRSRAPGSSASSSTRSPRPTAGRVAASTRPDRRAGPHHPFAEQRGHERGSRLSPRCGWAYPSASRARGASSEPRAFAGWGGRGLPDLPAPDWAAVDAAPLEELIEVIRPGGLAPQKAPRIQAALRALLANGGGYSLDFLAKRPPLEARDWLAAIPGIARRRLRSCCCSRSARR